MVDGVGLLWVIIAVLSELFGTAGIEGRVGPSLVMMLLAQHVVNMVGKGGVLPARTTYWH
jgi:hypothetical protein